MRLAYFSPLGPQRSGISDYSEELLPHLAARAEIDLFVDGFEPSNEELRARFRVFDYRRDPAALRLLDRYDAAVYHVGNDHRYHSGISEALIEHPGVVVFHDFALQDFFLGLARERGDVNVYLEEVEACHGVEARREAEETLAAGGTPPLVSRPTDFPLNLRLARAARGIIVHSEWSRRRFERIAPATPAARIHMPVKLPPASRPLETATARARRDGPVRIANFGLITPGKGIERALAALASLKSEYDFRYVLVGEPNSFFDVRELVRAHGMADRVSVTGHVSLEEFERHIAEADIAINIRERTVGETSASLCRIMAAGVAAIVSDVGWFSELPDDAVVKVDADECLDAELRAYLRRLIEDAPLREKIGENARCYVLAEHAIERSADAYLAFIAEVVAGGARRSFVRGVSSEISRLGIDPDADAALLETVAAEVAALAPAHAFAASAAATHDAQSSTRFANASKPVALVPDADAPDVAETSARGRLRKVGGVDYKRAAVEYPRKLNAERHHHLFTKPFYNLAHKPAKYSGEGMDADMHRHFCDFANMAVRLALPAGRRILDVGCGSGWLSEYFARLGYEVTGIDISPELIEISQQRTACVPYDVDHETPLLCRFLVHDVEAAPLEEKFDAVVCYDSLHHFEDERAVLRHIAGMVDYGGLLFILEGDKPEEGSASETELVEVMQRYETLESPFDPAYLRALVVEHGFRVVGDYVSVNGLFERERVEGDRVSFEREEVNYLLCKKVVRGVASAASVPDSAAPGRLAARITHGDKLPQHINAGETFMLPLTIENTGDTLWLTGPASRRGACMLGVSLLNDSGEVVGERHGEPPLPHAVAPCERVDLKLTLRAPDAAGSYRLKIDLVAQHVCWFEQHGSEPLVLAFEVRRGDFTTG